MCRYGTHLLLLLLLASLSAGCDSTVSDPIRVLVPREVGSSQYTTMESGLKYYDFKTGDGEEATDTSRVRVHYAAWLTNDQLISSSHNSSKPLSVDLGAGTVVLGWVEGLPGMREGGERQLVVPPSLAYGDEGVPEAGIPPDATIIYEIELLAVERP